MEGGIGGELCFIGECSKKCPVACANKSSKMLHTALVDSEETIHKLQDTKPQLIEGRGILTAPTAVPACAAVAPSIGLLSVDTFDDAANDALDALSSCQCCLLGGQQRSLKKMYFHLGRTEIYSDMLKECFDIRLSVGSEKSGICEVCVGRLRDASNFKQQVQHSQLELRKRLKKALGLLEEEPAAAVKRETGEDKMSYILLDEESAVELSDDDGASPVTVMCEGDVKSETVEDGTRDSPPALEEPEAVVKSEIDEDDDEMNGNLSDDGHSVKSEQPDDDATSDEDLSPACSLSARAREQLAMTCSVRLERLNGLEVHMCHICHMTFEQESSLATHMMEHDDNQLTDTYICDVCKQQFTLRGDFERHISTHAREKPFHCQICYKSFNNRSNMRRHVLIHKGEKPFKCEICCKSFTSRGNMIRHVIIHTGEKLFKCDICNKQFSSKSGMGRHVRKHAKPQTFQMRESLKCEICNKQFALKRSLIEHVQTHTKQKTYSCDTCNKPFLNEYGLKRHVIIHTGQKPYSCDMCDRRFTDKSSMRKHVNFILHAFKCICNKQFVLKRDLLTHFKIHTSQMPFECEMHKAVVQPPALNE